MNRYLTRLLDRPIVDRASIAVYSRARYAWLRLRERGNGRLEPSPDGYPLPPTWLIFMISGTVNQQWFFDGGRAVAQEIRSVLDAQGVPLEDAGRMLDFGCGCGRVVRHFAGLSDRVELHGSDYNADAIAWCRQALPFASFATNGELPPLDYDDAVFGVAWAMSVFTHFPEHAQLAWRDELHRVVRPGGHALVTLHGERFTDRLTPDELAMYRQDELVVRFGGVIGSNQCTAFHSPGYTRSLFSSDAGWEILAHVPGSQGWSSAAEPAQRSSPQDLVVLRRV